MEQSKIIDTVEMYLPPVRDPPSGRVPEQGPDWFLVATEACGGGTPDLGYVLEVWVYGGI